nr:MAG TPA: hypothetical protein [Caudoviricetes sp.]
MLFISEIFSYPVVGRVPAVASAAYNRVTPAVLSWIPAIKIVPPNFLGRHLAQRHSALSALLVCVDSKILVRYALIPGDNAVNSGILQIGHRIAHGTSESHLGKLIVDGFNDILCLGLLVPYTVRVDVYLVHQRHGVFQIWCRCSHFLKHTVVAFNDGDGRKFCGAVYIFARHKNSFIGRSKRSCNLTEKERFNVYDTDRLLKSPS